MSMDKHRCKLCARVFSNGRALGGHMRSHLATLPPPTPRKKTEHPPPPQLGDGTESDSSSTQSDDPARFNPVGCNYGLRENPKRSVRASDPEFLDAGSVVQDRESETESTQTLTRRRSTKKRSGRAQRPNGSRSRAGFEPKRVKLDVGVKSESAAESTPVSSVSDPSCQDEEVALCLMMLSRDVWVEEKEKEKEMEMEMEKEKEKEKEKSADSAELKTRLTRSARFKCLGCKKKFRTNTALVGHKASSKECQVEQERTYGEKTRIYECPFCYKVFGSGQALGGHKRAHLLGGMGSSMTNTNLAPNHDLDVDVLDVADRSNKDGNISNDDKVGDNTTSFMLDLNLPAPVEDYEVS